MCVCVLVNDGRRAAPCASSYFLFEPEDQVMEHNLMYYKAYSDQWGFFTAQTMREIKQFAYSTCVCVASSHSCPSPCIWGVLAALKCP